LRAGHLEISNPANAAWYPFVPGFAMLMEENCAGITGTQEFSRNGFEKMLVIPMQAGSAKFAAFPWVSLANQAAQRIE